MHRPEVEDQEVAHQTGIEAREGINLVGIESSEEVEVLDSPTMVEETQETFSSNFNKQEDDEQETVPSQNFRRKLFSETKHDDRASASQQNKNNFGFKRLIDPESDLLPQKFAKNRDNSFKIVPRVEVNSSSNNIRQRKNLIDELT